MPTVYEQRPSGLVAPKEPPKPKPVRGYLEIENDEHRKEAYQALQTLHDITSTGCGIVLPGKDRRNAQQKMVKQLAQLLLGDDTGFWEKC